jgi:hypothetical protein
MQLWDTCINTWETATMTDHLTTTGRLDQARALHNVFVFEDLVAGAEQGFVLPQAGQDGDWVKENMAEFERRAREGDGSMKQLIEEVKARERRS